MLHDILAEERYAHLTASAQVLLQNLLPNLNGLTARSGRSTCGDRASVDFVVYNRVTNQPLLAIEVDGFAFHENRPGQRARTRSRTRSWPLTGCGYCGCGRRAAEKNGEFGSSWTTLRPEDIWSHQPGLLPGATWLPTPSTVITKAFFLAKDNYRIGA